MADKAEKKPDAAAPAAPTGGKPDESHSKAGFLTRTPVLLGGVMLIEAVVLFAGFKVLGGHPQTAPGAEISVDEKGEKGDGKGGKSDKRTVELPVLDTKAPNHTNGRTYLYDVSVFAVVKAENEERVKTLLKDNKALIEDRLSTIVRESDPEKLGGGSEPGLETLRRQVKYQLDRIAGEGLIEEVLVPRCIPFRTDY